MGEVDLFTTREIAIAIWLLILSALALSQQKIRASFKKVLEAFFQQAILVTTTLMIAYVVGIVLALDALSLWTNSLLKDTIIWFLFFATPVAFSSFASRSDDEGFSAILGDSLRLTVLVEFLVNSYTFSLPVELVFVPALTFVMTMHGFASSYKKYSSVAAIFNTLQALIGLGVLVFVIVRAFADLPNLITIETARELLLPPVMSLLFAPFIYIMQVFLSYESLFTVLRMGTDKEGSLKGYARRRLFGQSRFSLKRIRKFHRAHGFELAQIQSEQDVDRILRSFEE